MKTKKGTRALSTLQRLRGVPADHPLVLTEAQGIEAQLEREREATEAHGALALVKEMFGVASMRYRLLLALGTGLFGQWSASVLLSARSHMHMPIADGAGVAVALLPPMRPSSLRCWA